MMPVSEIHNCDCMDYMRGIPDGFFDLAVVDPPYGIADNPSRHKDCGTLKDRVLNRNADRFAEWDKAPSKEYFAELSRVSRNRIIWGGNYFGLPPTRCFICWDKVQPWDNFSACEYAWTSFNKPAKLFRYDNRTGGKIHPTQKPVALYAWIFEKFAKPGMRILDTHLGSGSSRIAAYRMGLDFYGCEIDMEYFRASDERFRREYLGMERAGNETVTQQSLFNE